MNLRAPGALVHCELVKHMSKYHSFQHTYLKFKFGNLALSILDSGTLIALFFLPQGVMAINLKPKMIINSNGF